ncbi:MAG: polysaccharide deacetylase family protein, partial [Caldiserica bacterium]|nr:polysaccharide deacetylase family protein [Caldisericota bacterium]
MKKITSTLSWQIWTDRLSGIRIHGMKSKLALVSALMLLASTPVPTHAGFELGKRQIWPVLPSNEVKALILEYHLIETPPATAKHPDLYVREQTFKKHLEMLRETGLKCISFEDAISQIDAGNFDTSNVVITFDDGYLDNFAVAQKLSNLGHGGTFYIPTFYPGKSQPAQNLTYMPWEDIKKVFDMGFEIGAHSVQHINLQNCKPNRVEFEISESINDIYDHVGKKPTTFSIPMGMYTNQVIVGIEKYGLKGCVISNYGYLTKFNVNNAPRIKIEEGTTMRSVIELYLSRN